jgi:hypothetical protein
VLQQALAEALPVRHSCVRTGDDEARPRFRLSSPHSTLRIDHSPRPPSLHPCSDSECEPNKQPPTRLVRPVLSQARHAAAAISICGGASVRGLSGVLGASVMQGAWGSGGDGRVVAYAPPRRRHRCEQPARASWVMPLAMQIATISRSAGQYNSRVRILLEPRPAPGRLRPRLRQHPGRARLPRQRLPSEIRTTLRHRLQLPVPRHLQPHHQLRRARLPVPPPRAQLSPCKPSHTIPLTKTTPSSDKPSPATTSLSQRHQRATQASSLTPWQPAYAQCMVNLGFASLDPCARPARLARRIPSTWVKVLLRAMDLPRTLKGIPFPRAHSQGALARPPSS